MNFCRLQRSNFGRAFILFLGRAHAQLSKLCADYTVPGAISMGRQPSYCQRGPQRSGNTEYVDLHFVSQYHTFSPAGLLFTATHTEHYLRRVRRH